MVRFTDANSSQEVIRGTHKLSRLSPLFLTQLTSIRRHYEPFLATTHPHPFDSQTFLVGRDAELMATVEVNHGGFVSFTEQQPSLLRQRILLSFAQVLWLLARSQ